MFRVNNITVHVNRARATNLFIYNSLINNVFIIRSRLEALVHNVESIFGVTLSFVLLRRSKNDYVRKVALGKKFCMEIN